MNLVLDIIFFISILLGKSFFPFRTKKKNKIILLIRTDLIGDFVLFSPTIRLINEAYPEYKIVLAVQDSVRDIAELFVDAPNIISFNKELFVKKGKIKVDLYSSEKIFLGSEFLETGDFIHLTSGGHGFEILEDTVMIEVKQGPYLGVDDKERFQGVENDTSK